MKKWLSVLAVVMALCLLPVCAMAGYKVENGTYIFSGLTNASETIDVTNKVIFEKGSSLQKNSTTALSVSDNNDIYIEMNDSSIIVVPNQDNSGTGAHAILLTGNGDVFIRGIGNNLIQGGFDPSGASNAIYARGNVTLDGCFTIKGGTGDDDNTNGVIPAIYTRGTVTLSGGITVEGSPAINAKKVCIADKTGRDVNVYVGKDDPVLVEGSPFANGADITELVKGAKYIQTVDVPAAVTASSAPKTGDSANLALWACLLVVSVLGMAGMKRKAKRS